jgi:DNA-binding MarR family transcriptional regulator
MIAIVGMTNVGAANKIDAIRNTGAAMSPGTTLTPRIIGQAEKTLNAILFRLLAGPGLTEAQWITLTLTAAGGGATGRGQLVAQVAHGLKVGEAQAREHLASLAAARLVADPGDDAEPVRLTAAGTEVFAQIRAAVTEVTQRLWGGLPAQDLATAGRVLSIITERADAELARA